MSNEELLADVRNKLSPASHLTALIERYFNEAMTAENYEKLHHLIKEQIPKAKQSFDYIRNFKL